MIIYNGPSTIDPSTNIVVIARDQSSNRKTGNMIQTYILVRDTDPRLANKTGADFAICGKCRHRGQATDDPKRKLAVGRTCYVNIAQGVLIVWQAFQRGKYEAITGHDDIAAIGAGRIVRLGTYGDPAAVPGYIWESLLSRAKGRTGYSHQINQPGADVRPDLCMISADTIEEATAAWDQGFRTFRTIPIKSTLAETLAQIDRSRETLCPASDEAGKRVQCDQCKLCSGSGLSAKSIAIPMHDAGSNNRKKGAAYA